MRTLNKNIEAVQCEKKSWENELFKSLRNYRATPHLSMGQTTAFAMFGVAILLRKQDAAVKDYETKCGTQKGTQIT